MLPESNFKMGNVYFLKCGVQSQRMTQCYLLPPRPCLSVKTGPWQTKDGLGQEKNTLEDSLAKRQKMRYGSKDKRAGVRKSAYVKRKGSQRLDRHRDGKDVRGYCAHSRQKGK